MLLERKGILSGSSDTSIDRQREAILVRGARTPIEKHFLKMGFPAYAMETQKHHLALYSVFKLLACANV